MQQSEDKQVLLGEEVALMAQAIVHLTQLNDALVDLLRGRLASRIVIL